MSKPLDQLVASQAGVSQADLEVAFLELPELEAELVTVEAPLLAAREAKLKARLALEKATDKVRDAIAVRDPVFEELQRASWIVRNADPDYASPPTGIMPPEVRSMRVEGDS